MKEKIYKNRKTILFIGVILAITGVFVGYYTYGTEPWETVGGFLCGLGFGISLITFGLKNPKDI